MYIRVFGMLKSTICVVKTCYICILPYKYLTKKIHHKDRTMNTEIIKKFNIEKFNTKLILDKPNDIADFDGITYDTAIGN